VYLTFILVLECLDLNLGSTSAYLYCKIGVLVVDPGLTSNTNNTFTLVLECLDLNLGSTTTYYYCKLGVHVVDYGLKSNTNNTSTCVPYAYLTCLGTYPAYLYHEYTTFLLSLVFHAPKPIKLGPKGSSTKSRGSVKHSQKSKNLEQFESNKH
jgi:hypothetical protein